MRACMYSAPRKHYTIKKKKISRGVSFDKLYVLTKYGPRRSDCSIGDDAHEPGDHSSSHEETEQRVTTRAYCKYIKLFQSIANPVSPFIFTLVNKFESDLKDKIDLRQKVKRQRARVLRRKKNYANKKKM